MSERLAQSLLLGALILLPVRCVPAETPEDPIYIKTSNGWNAAYAHGNEYAEFRVPGNGAKLQDPYHILLQKNVGMMVSFVDKKELQNDRDLLSAHAQWEINYWHQHVSFDAEGECELLPADKTRVLSTQPGKEQKD